MATAGAPEELTARLLGAAGATVTGVDIDVNTADVDELSPEVAVARIGLGGPAGGREVTARLGLGLAMAAATGAPVGLADTVMDRLAVAVPGDDLLGPFLDRVSLADRRFRAAPWPALVGRLPRRPRYEPRNLAFTDGLDRWDLDRGSLRETDLSGRPDYSAAAEGQSAVLSSDVPRPAGTAALVQAIYADDYRGVTVVFRGEIRTGAVTEQAGLRLEILRQQWPASPVRADHGLTVSRSHDWTSHQITALIPQDAQIIRFGIALTGPGRIALRHPELRAAEPARGA
jgi:hypothetical protein